jgi:DNA mismatch repair ATPase MutS
VRKLEKDETCVKREVIQMVTRGTFQQAGLLDGSADPLMSYEPKYILAYKKYGCNFGVCFFDTNTLKIYLGHFVEEDPSLVQSFRTLLSQLRPVEVISEKELMNSSVIKMIKNSPVSPTVTHMPPAKCYSTHKTKSELRVKYFAEKSESEWPEALRELLKEDEQGDGLADISGADLAFQALGMAMQFLEDAMIGERIISTGIYHRYLPETFSSDCGRMVLDSQALQHLEVVESAAGHKEGSLLAFVDHC